MRGWERNTVKWSEKIWACLLLLFLLCSAKAEAAEITVSAAMSLKAPFEEIAKVFSATHKADRIYLNFAASGVLAKQIEGGAPVDLFASASPDEMDTLERKGFIISALRRDFAGNSIVVITPLRPATAVRNLKDLEKKGIQRIVIGNPATAPAGKYAEEILKKAGLWDRLQGKTVYAEHVRQIMDYVSRGEADAGMVFLSDAISRKDEVQAVWEAPEDMHRPIRYVIAPIKGTAGEKLARDFMEIALSEKGGNILRKYGFRKISPAGN
jgi:molybdate transport system substrate-binding protein